MTAGRRDQRTNADDRRKQSEACVTRISDRHSKSWNTDTPQKQCDRHRTFHAALISVFDPTRSIRTLRLTRMEGVVHTTTIGIRTEQHPGAALEDRR